MAVEGKRSHSVRCATAVRSALAGLGVTSRRRGSRALILSLCLLVVVLSAALLACGGDPYSGTWKSTQKGDEFTLRISPANDGWWQLVTLTPSGNEVSNHSYAAEIDGLLQTGNGAQTFERKGDALLWRLMAELPDPPLELKRQ